MSEERSGFGGFDDLFERLIGDLGSTLGGLPRSGGREAARRTPRLDRFGRDLTEAARQGRLDPVIGRDAEVAQVLEVLSRRMKNNPVLVGDPGVGKTAIAEGIAQRVAEGDVPEALRGVRVVALDLTGMISGTRYRGDFEQRMTQVIDEVTAADPPVVLFIDELHSLIGGGAAEGAPMDAASMLKPALARGDLRMIGATTVRDYRRHIEKDPALERRFEPVHVAEPTVAATIAILHGLRPRYESHHSVRIEDDALTAAAELSHRYVADRLLPDKAIDLIDRASSRARIATTGPRQADDSTELIRNRIAELRPERDAAIDAEEFERAQRLTDELATAEGQLAAADAAGSDAAVGIVTAEDIAAAVAQSTGIPIARLSTTDRDRLLGLEGLLHRRVVGQDAAVESVADAVRAARAGLADPQRPDGSFLFLGPTGVGKTELARALAEALFGTPDALLRFDMSEYAEQGSALRLVGAPPGHLGYDDAGQLTEAVRRTPYAVLLLDEIEKAHRDVTGTLLQVLDAGRLTDSHGRTVDFSNTVIIMTSNLGAERLLAAAAAGRPLEEVRDPLMTTVRLHFRAEFLNRIDEVVLFHALDRGQLRRITALMLAQTTARLAAQGIVLEATDDALDWLADHGHQPEHGARPLRRTIAQQVERPLSRLIIATDLATGQHVLIDTHDQQLSITLRTPSGPATPSRS